MAKFKCLDCGNIFNGDNATMTCEKCNSQNITTQSSSPIVKIIATIVAAIIVIVIAINSCGSEPTVSLSSDEYNNVTITVTGISARTLKMDYQIEIYSGGNIHDKRYFDGSNKSITYNSSHMLDGQCYEFLITPKNKKTSNIKWTTNNKFCMPIAPIIFTPTISGIISTPSQKTRKYTVTIKVDSIPDGVNLKYSIDNNTQSSSKFTNISHGSYNITVSCGNNSTSQPLILKEITPIVNLTMGDIQDIFDKVSNGTLSAGKAQDKLASGSVELKKPINGMKTLWDILMEAEGFEIKYKIIAFDNDPNTGKIASGSLILTEQ